MVQIYDVGKVSQPYFVMEFLEGLTLASRLARGPMSQNGALESSGRCVTDCTRFIGLASCIVISSQSNVMLTSDLQHCQLLDFGLADDHNSSQSESSSLSGTRGYLPPERLKGFPGDYRSRLLQSGLLLMRCLRDGYCTS